MHTCIVCQAHVQARHRHTDSNWFLCPLGKLIVFADENRSQKSDENNQNIALQAPLFPDFISKRKGKTRVIVIIILFGRVHNLVPTTQNSNVKMVFRVSRSAPLPKGTHHRARCFLIELGEDLSRCCST